MEGKHSPKLTKRDRELLGVLDNGPGRAGWPLSKWPDVEGAYASLVDRGLCKHRHLGSYPGLEITPAGRAALQAGDPQ